MEGGRGGRVARVKEAAAAVGGGGWGLELCARAASPIQIPSRKSLRVRGLGGSRPLPRSKVFVIDDRVCTRPGAHSEGRRRRRNRGKWRPWGAGTELCAALASLQRTRVGCRHEDLMLRNTSHGSQEYS